MQLRMSQCWPPPFDVGVAGPTWRKARRWWGKGGGARGRRGQSPRLEAPVIPPSGIA